ESLIRDSPNSCGVRTSSSSHCCGALSSSASGWIAIFAVEAEDSEASSVAFDMGLPSGGTIGDCRAPTLDGVGSAPCLFDCSRAHRWLVMRAGLRLARELFGPRTVAADQIGWLIKACLLQNAAGERR